MAAGKTGTVQLDGTETLISNFNLVRDIYGTKKLKSLLRPAGRVMQKAIQSQAPVRTEPAGGLRKRKGGMLYYPGNLKMGIKVATYPRSSSIFVLPKLLKGSAAKDVQSVGNVVAEGVASGGEAKSDPFYAHIVEFGGQLANGTQLPPNPFMQRGFNLGVTPATVKMAESMAKALYKVKFKRV